MQHNVDGKQHKDNDRQAGQPQHKVERHLTHDSGCIDDGCTTSTDVVERKVVACASAGFRFAVPKADPGRAAINRRAKRIVLVQSDQLIRASDSLPVHRIDTCSRPEQRNNDLFENFGALDSQTMEVTSDHDKAPQEPGRNELVRALIAACGILRFVRLLEPEKADVAQMCEFHDDKYIETLFACDQDVDDVEEDDLLDYNLVDDAAPFPGVANHAAWVAGASIIAAAELVRGSADVAINWSGGRHHAGREHASGFCYVNDVVLAVLQLQRRFSKVMVIDIDVHHGDGVERAFLHSDKVHTMSLHQLEPGFFPGTGSSVETGRGRGKGFNTNIALPRGTSGDDFCNIFKAHLQEQANCFQPSAIVLVCGADALASDPRGGLLLEPKHICQAVTLVKKLVMRQNLPLLALGGGGYNFCQTARCWALATAVLAECPSQMPKDVPEHEYFERYSQCSWQL